MRVVRCLRELGAAGRKPLVLAAGFFDGVHRGHERVIGSAVSRARALGGSAWVLTFDAHPLRVLRPEAAPRLLTSTEHKLRLLAGLGLDGCLLLKFTAALARTEPEAFLRALTRAAPGLKEIVVGGNWRFGCGGRGDVDLLVRYGRERDIRVRVTDPVLWRGAPVSSTRVREAVGAGSMAAAAAMLGRPFSILGTVVKGARLGRTLGFPTANIRPSNEVCPATGVYAARALLDRRAHAGVLNVGFRPTVRPAAAADPVIELHLFDFERDIYGAAIEVFFMARLRDERRFATLADMVGQMGRDRDRAARLLESEKWARVWKKTLQRGFASLHSCDKSR